MAQLLPKALGTQSIYSLYICVVHNMHYTHHVRLLVLVPQEYQNISVEPLVKSTGVAIIFGGGFFNIRHRENNKVLFVQQHEVTSYTMEVQCLQLVEGRGVESSDVYGLMS